MTEAAAGGTNTGWLGWPRGLPSLDGWRAYVAGVFYVALAAVTLVVIAGTLWALVVDGLYNAPAASRWGFRTATLPNGAIVGGTTPAADRAGLRVWDAIVAIDGDATPAHATEYAIAKRLRRVAGPTLALTVRGEGGDVRTVRLRARDGVWLAPDPMTRLPLWVFAALTILPQPALLLFAASVLLFVRRPRDPEAMLLATALLLVNYTPDLVWWTRGIGLPLTTIAHLGTIGWLLTYVGMAGFPDGRFATRWSRAVVIAVLAFEAAILALRVHYDGVVPADVQAVVATLNAVLGGAAAVAVVLRYRALPPGPARQQIKWAVGGFAAAAVMVVVFMPADPSVFLLSGNPWLFLLWQGASVVIQGAFALGLLVSLLGYRLYDAEAALAKSLAYAALTAGIVGIFAACSKLIELLGDRLLSGRLGAIAGIVGSVVAAILIGPLHHRTKLWAERRFQRRLLRLRRDLPALVDDLRETETLAAIGAAVAAQVAAGVRAERAAVAVDGAVIAAHGVSEGAAAAWLATAPSEAGPIACDADDPLFPVRVALESGGTGIGTAGDAAPVGWLLVGPRPDGSLIGRAERAALAEIADPVARAVQTVARRAARERANAVRIDTLEERLARALEALERVSGREGPAPAAT
jgi:hypothetical protein